MRLRRARRAARRLVRGRRRRADRGDRPERRRQDDAAADPRRRAEADARARSRHDGAIGWVPQQPALYSKLSVAENLRLFARLEKVADVERDGRADARADRAGRARRRRGRQALGRQPPAGQHRDRPARRPAVLLLDEPSASLDPRQRERLWDFVGELAAADRGRSPRTTSARPSATPTACSCWPTASCCSPARPRELETATAATPRRPTSRPRSCASSTSEATDALAAAQGPADPAPLAAAGRRCS